MEPRSERVPVPGEGGLRLRVLHWGASGPPLVLLHGAGANAHWWDHIAPALARTHRVSALDFRGHGESDFPDEVVPSAFGRDLRALIEHLGAAVPVIVGHSLGAHVAFEHASRVGGVGRLVLLDISRGASHTTRRAARLALALRRTYPDRERAVARFQVLPPARHVAPALLRHIALHSIRREPDGRFGYAFDARWFGLPGREREPADRVTCPTLLVRGADSTLLTPEGARELVAELPRGRLVELPGAGHHVHLDQPEAVLAALQPFLAEGEWGGPPLVS